MASQAWRRRIFRAARGWTRPSRLALLALAALLSGVAVVSAQTAPSSPPPTITVSGQATASQPPDTATIFGSVVSDADTPAAATDANSRALTAVINALKALGVTDADLQTSGFSVSPRYSYTQPQPGEPTPPPQIVGYEAVNGISVQTKKLDGIGDLFAAMAGAGATNLSGPQYSIADPEQLRIQAIAAATQDALQKARAAAAALGVQLGPVLSVAEGFSSAPPAVGQAPPPPTRVATPAPPPLAPPVSPPSNLTANASVSVVFGIINPGTATPTP
ncbi:MAG TPA: SIMPL domain-containing protein [Dehalococcoidia bacterium]|nr:SIMPL domain-containing protein [Dehalococcoidia bacterium]